VVWDLFRYFYPFPEGYPPPDAGCFLRRLWIIPGGILILLPLYLQAIIAGGSFPGTFRGGRAFYQKLFLYGGFWEVSIAFHHYYIIAFCNKGIVP
jgi:hypothetical protein